MRRGARARTANSCPSSWHAGSWWWWLQQAQASSALQLQWNSEMKDTALAERVARLDPGFFFAAWPHHLSVRPNSSQHRGMSGALELSLAYVPLGRIIESPPSDRRGGRGDMWQGSELPLTGNDL